jgi:hypothetical protein
MPTDYFHSPRKQETVFIGVSSVVKKNANAIYPWKLQFDAIHISREE